MRANSLVVFFCLLFLTKPVLAQESVLDKRIDLSFNNTSLEEILETISAKNEVKFSYSSTSLDLKQRVTGNFKNAKTSDVLTSIFESRGIEWKLIAGQITLKQAEIVFVRLCGKISDSLQLSPVEYAVVYVKECNLSVQTDYSGNFCFEKIPVGNHTLVVKAFGYKPFETNINTAKQHVSIQLSQQNIDLQETIVTSDKIIENTNVSETQLNPSQVEAAKGVSNDPLKAITSVPGVLAIVDFYGPQDIHIRGGEGYENLFLLDNIRLPFPFYFIGQSAINPDMINKTELLTGGYNANYGNAMSSVFNFSTRDGSMEKYSGHMDISFFNSSALIQGPIIKNKLSGIIGFRQSNIDLILRALGFKTNMNDITGKFTYIINEKNKLSFTSLYVTDKLDFSGRETILLGLKAEDKINAQSVQLQSVISAKAYNKLSLLYSAIDINASYKEIVYKLNNASYSLRDDYTFYPTPNTKLKTGFEFNVISEKARMKDIYRATDIVFFDTLLLEQDKKTDNINYQPGAYVFYEGKQGKRFNYIVGARTDYTYLNNAFDFSPRITLGYDVTPSTVLSAAWGRFTQNPDIYSSVKNKNIRSNNCYHYILSLKQNIYGDLKARGEVYYKQYTSLVVFDTSGTITNSGYGYANGFELSLIKSKGRLSGWLSYAYSNSERKRNLQDKIYPTYYDQRHAYNAQITYTVKDRRRRWFVPTSYSVQFKYATGNPYTPIVGIDSTAGKYQFLGGAINSVRNSDYQNLNAKVQWNRMMGKNNRHSLIYYVDFWNIYSSKNLIERIYTLTKTGQYTVENRFTTPFLLSVGLKIIFNDLSRQ